MLARTCQELVEKEVVLLLPEYIEQRSTMLELVARVASNEVLHVHPASQAGTPEDDCLPRAIDDPVAVYAKDTV